MLTRAPGCSAPIVVTFKVWGMISTENASPLTSLTVKDTPSSAIEPFGAMKRDSAGGTANDSRAIGEVVARAELGEAVDVAAHHVTAKFVAKPQRALQIEPGAAPPGCAVVTSQRLGGGVDGERGPVAGTAALDHGQADAGTGNRRADRDAVGVVAACDGQAAQPLSLFLNFKNFA